MGHMSIFLKILKDKISPFGRPTKENILKFRYIELEIGGNIHLKILVGFTRTS